MPVLLPMPMLVLALVLVLVPVPMPVHMLVLCCAWTKYCLKISACFHVGPELY